MIHRAASEGTQIALECSIPRLLPTLLHLCHESPRIGRLSFEPLVDFVGCQVNPDSEHLGYYAPISVLQTSSYIPHVLLVEFDRYTADQGGEELQP